MSKKQDILEKLLKCQKEGKLNNYHVIAKVEALPEAAFEDPKPLFKVKAKLTDAHYQQVASTHMGDYKYDDDVASYWHGPGLKYNNEGHPDEASSKKIEANIRQHFDNKTPRATKMVERHFKKNGLEKAGKKAVPTHAVVAGLQDNIDPEDHDSPKTLRDVIHNHMANLQSFGRASKDEFYTNDKYRNKIEGALVSHFYPDHKPLKKKDKNIIHDISIKGHASALKEQSGQDLPHATHDMVSHSFHSSTDWDEPNRMAQLAVEHGKAGHKVHVSQHEGGNLMTVWKPKKGK